MTDNKCSPLQDYISDWARIIWDATGDQTKVDRAILLADLNGMFDPVKVAGLTSIAQTAQRCSCARAGFPGSCDNCDADSGPIKHWRERALEAESAQSKPVAWVIPGDDNARDNGSIDAMAWEEGEFSKPLYAAPTQNQRDKEILSLVRVWRECPAERRPSAAALADRIIETLSLSSTNSGCGK